MAEKTIRLSKRRPPMPIVPDSAACRWCAASLLYPPGHKKAGQPNHRRRWCSKEDAPCVSEYRIASFQGDLRKALWKRDRGRCAGCGKTGADWDADHIVPLWKVPDEVRLDERHLYWGLSNGQTLCTCCHSIKTKQEASERAEIKKRQRLLEKQKKSEL